MKKIPFGVTGLLLVVLLLAVVHVGVVSFVSYRNTSLPAQIQALTLENTELRRQLVEKDNERYLYESAQKSNDTVNMIAQWHVFQPIILLLGAICSVVFLPVVWMSWTYALRCYVVALRKLDA